METIIDTLTSLWLFDIWVFSQWWLYVPLLIPALVYLAFFFVKWVVITAPIWLPLLIIIKAFHPDTKSKSGTGS